MIIATIDDPFDATAWEAAMEQTCNSPLPPEAYKDPEQWAVEELVASVEATRTAPLSPRGRTCPMTCWGWSSHDDHGGFD